MPAFAARALRKAVCTSRNLFSKMFMWFSTAILLDETVAAFARSSIAARLRGSTSRRRLWFVALTSASAPLAHRSRECRRAQHYPGSVSSAVGCLADQFHSRSANPDMTHTSHSLGIRHIPRHEQCPQFISRALSERTLKSWTKSCAATTSKPVKCIKSIYFAHQLRDAIRHVKYATD